MRPDDINMWINGVPQYVSSIQIANGRVTIYTLVHDYSFDIAALRKALKPKAKQPVSGGGRAKVQEPISRTPPPIRSFSANHNFSRARE